jgi:hypothetical protein
MNCGVNIPTLVQKGVKRLGCHPFTGMSQGPPGLPVPTSSSFKDCGSPLVLGLLPLLMDEERKSTTFIRVNLATPLSAHLLDMIWVIVLLSGLVLGTLLGTLLKETMSIRRGASGKKIVIFIYVSLQQVDIMHTLLA